MRTLRAASLILGLAALAHCGSTPAAPATFACGTLRCQGGAEYCQDTAHPGGAHAYACQPLPATCVGNPCTSCLSGIANQISCVSITVAGTQEVILTLPN